MGKLASVLNDRQYTFPEGSDPIVNVGDWYWVESSGEGGKRFVCVVQIGTNYAEVESPNGSVERVHFDDFLRRCERERDPDAVIDSKIAEKKERVSALLLRVKEITSRLSISVGPTLTTGNETMALSVRGSGQDMEGYGKALEKAKKETLPDLFKKIENENRSLASWMTAKVLPMRAQAKGLRSTIEAIEERIFSVELYAGLTERVELIRDGEPADVSEKVRLIQRRCYMDEECLARYETGGMEFNDILGFDSWISRPENADRLLPFPRCIASFRVRRNAKEREMVNLSDFLNIASMMKADESTFLFLRNGDRIYRMKTKIDFGPKLFPDMERGLLRGKIWAEMSSGSIRRLVSDDEHSGIVEDRRREKADWEKKNRAYEEALKTPDAKARAKAKKLKSPDASCVDAKWPGMGPYFWEEYVPYDKSDVRFDDISKKLESDIKDHNKIALIVQGLLDRSPVFHPHPMWQIWTPEGFSSAMELIYDEDRALPAGLKPDFESYRQSLNASLKVGSVTVGQEDAWERYEASKESKRRDRDWRDKDRYHRPTHWRPQGNPGPGTLAKVATYSAKIGQCTYAWNRKRQTHPGYGDSIRTSFSCSKDAILNVDAYKPGDFRTFFDDPRTRMEYLKWAPFLLEAEEYHAGNRRILEPVPVEKKRSESSWDGKRRYENRKRRKALIGKAVRLVQSVKLTNGKVHAAGSLWRVYGGKADVFDIYGIREDGRRESPDRSIINLRYPFFAVDPSVPERSAALEKEGQDDDGED